MYKKIFFIVFSVLILSASAPRAEAITAGEIQALIAKLQQQIAELQRQLAEVQEQPAAWCHDFTVNLGIGSSGSEVEALGIALEKEGLIAGSVTQFDEEVASEIVGFQEKYKNEILTPARLKHGNGYVGKLTRAKLNKLYGCGAAIPAVPAQPAMPTEQPAVPAIPVIPTQPATAPATTVVTTSSPPISSGSINVLNPVSGDSFTTKSIPIIKWTASDVSRGVVVWLCGTKCRVITESDGVSSNINQIQWTFSSSDIGNNLKIKISDADNPNVYGESGPFGILSDTVYTDDLIPEIVYPADGQALNYGSPHGYMFKVKPIFGAGGYRFQFYQNRILLYDNLVEEGSLDSNGEFAFWPGDKGYSRFQKGEVKVEIRALINNNWSKPKTIAINLSSPDLAPVSITKSLIGPRAGETIIFDSGVQNKGWAAADAFNVKWFVDDVQAGYGSHSGVSGGVTEMNGNSQFTWTAVEGLHAVKFVVDTDNHVAESDETNNAVSLNAVVLPVIVPSITVLSPNGEEQWVAGNTYEIGWTRSNFKPGEYTGRIDLYKGNSWYGNIKTWTLTEGASGETVTETALWKAGDMKGGIGEGSDYKVYVKFESTGGATEVSDISNNYFSIAESSVTVVSPNGGEQWKAGEVQTIKWTSVDYGSGVSIQIGLRDTRYDPNTAKGEITIANTTNSGSYNWTIPSTIEVGSFFRIVIYIDGGGEGKSDLSNNNFQIIQAIACTDSDGGTNYYVKGTTKGLAADNVISTDTDSCSGSVLIEWLCLDSVYRANTNYTCASGCQDGICL